MGEKKRDVNSCTVRVDPTIPVATVKVENSICDLAQSEPSDFEKKALSIDEVYVK